MVWEYALKDIEEYAVQRLSPFWFMCTCIYDPVLCVHTPIADTYANAENILGYNRATICRRKYNVLGIRLCSPRINSLRYT